MVVDLGKIRAENRAKTAARQAANATIPPAPQTTPVVNATQQPAIPQAVNNTQWTPIVTSTPQIEQTVDTNNTGANSDYISLWNGKGVRRSSPQFKALLAWGMTEQDIINKLQSKTTAKQNTQTVEPQSIPPTEQVNSQQPTQPQQQPLPDFRDDSEARQAEIINNLNNYKTSNPWMFSDRALFEKSFSYNERSDLQKSLLDNWYSYNIEKAANISSLSRTPATDVASRYTDGDISDAELNTLQQTDPAKYEEVKTKIEEKKTMDKYSSLLYWEKEQQKTDFSSMIQNQMNSMMSQASTPDFYDEYEKELWSPDVLALSNDVSDIEWEIKQVQDEINTTKSELEAQFKWSGMSQWRINAIIQDQVQLLQNKANALNIKYQTAADKYNNKMTQIKDVLAVKEKQFSMQMQQEQQMMQKLSFSYGIYSDQQKRQDAMQASDLQFKRDIAMMNIKADNDFKQAIKFDQLQNWDINSADPYLVEKAVRNNVDSMMKQYDWLIVSSKDQLVERVQAWLKSWKSYSAVMNEITKDIQNKPEYQQRRNNKLGIDNKPISLWNWLIWQNGKVMSEQQFRDENNIPSTQVEAINQSIISERIANWWLSQFDDDSRVQALRDEYLGKDCGKQCAWYTWDVYKAITGKSISFGSTLESKINAIATIGKSTTPVVGGFVALDTGTEYGHTGYVTSISDDGKTITVLNSNYNGTAWNPDNRVTENTFSISKVRASSIAPWKQSPWATVWVLNNTVKTIIWSGKFTKDQVAAITSSIQSGDDPLTVIKNQAKNIMWQTQSNDLAAYEVAKGQMESISSLMQKYYDAGGKTDIFSGKYEKVINRLGKIDNPDLVNITTQIAVALQAYRKAVTGTAFSVQEWAEMAAIFPGINNTKGLNDAIIWARLKSFNDLIDTTYRNTIGASYDQLKPKEQQNTSTTPSSYITTSNSYFNWVIWGSRQNYASTFSY